jgi:D-aminopeptidase
MPIPKALEMIREAAADAVRNVAELKPFVVEGPVTVQVVFTDPSSVDPLEHLDFVTRVDGRTIRLEGEDFIRAFERFDALHFLAKLSR